MQVIYKKDSSWYNAYLKDQAFKKSGIPQLTDENHVIDYSNISIEPSVFNIDITTSSESFNIIFKEKDVVIRNITIPISAIQSHHRHSSQSIYGVDDVFTTDPVVIKTEQCYYLWDNTYLTKRRKPNGAPALRYTNVDSFTGVTQDQSTPQLPFELFFKSYSGNYDQSILVLRLDNQNSFNVSVDGSPQTIIENTTKFTAEITMTTQTTPTVGNIINVQVVSSQPELDSVELEPSVGILDRVYVKLTNGVGEFNILTSTFKPGDKIGCYAGVKRLTKLGSFSVVLS